MKNDNMMKYVINKVSGMSTEFEKNNSDLKRKFLIWNIESFNIIASKVTGNKGTFGTGYPFYALDDNLEGTLPIIEEQLRYNRQLVIDGMQVQRPIRNCISCLEENYDKMPDLKQICIPCPNVPHNLKPRKIINRLPDVDMWIICEDGKIEDTQEEITELLKSVNMYPSDINPIKSIEDVEKITNMIKNGKMPEIFLPIDAHIIEYSKIKELIQMVPEEIEKAKNTSATPYLPINPKSLRKQWQYDDEAYNFVYDFLSAFTPFNIPDELQNLINLSRKRVISNNTPEELFEILLRTATKSNFRRFHSNDLEQIFIKKWKCRGLPENNVNGNSVRTEL